MKYALRALRWATIILWILLVFLVITLVYSAFNIGINIGESQLLVKDDRIIWALPARINNSGLYGIYDLNITTVIEDVDGAILLRSSSFVPLISKEETRQIWHNISVSLEEIPNYQAYLTNDTNFIIKPSIRLNFAKVTPFFFTFNSTIPWGAPLYNLHVDEPNCQFNATHCIVSLNVSFENHSPYINLNGTLKVEVLNQNEEKIGMNSFPINVPPYQGNDNYPAYNETLTIPVDVSKLTRSGKVRLTFQTSMFSYETEVPYEFEEIF